MSRGKVRRLFLGGNTAEGFFGHFRHLVDGNQRRAFILKGGPGTGKSTFIRQLAAELLERGEDVELYHCSSDPASLDGMWAPGYGVSVMDGTAPHVVDPQYPGAADELIGLGDHWDERRLTRARPEIVRLRRETADRFSRAYALLRVCAGARRIAADIYRRAADPRLVDRVARELVDRLMSGGELPARRLAATAITPDGPQGFLADLWADDRVVLGGGLASAAPLLDRLAELSAEAGFAGERFMCGLEPTRVEHYASGSFAVIDGTAPHQAEGLPVIDCGELFVLSRLEEDRDEIRAAEGAYGAALGSAVSQLDDARRLHQRTEAIYIPTMDFPAIERLRRRVLRRALRLGRLLDCPSIG